MYFSRQAATDTEVGGVPIPEGDRVVLSYVSANRDERAFDDPDGLDVTRTPNDHVAFGAGGPHFCLGASLARIEARVMFESILTKFHGLRADGDPATMPRVRSNLIDGFAELPITWESISSPGKRRMCGARRPVRAGWHRTFGWIRRGGARSGTRRCRAGSACAARP
jgi:cytochrome P450